MPKVTVIIPNLNSSASIAQCLSTLYAQDFCDFETLLIDCGSMDESLDIVTNQFPSVRLLLAGDNVGSCSALNRGICEATGDFIATLSTSCLVPPDWLSSLCATIAADEDVFSVTSILVSEGSPSVVMRAGLGYTASGMPKDLYAKKPLSKLSAITRGQPKEVFAPAIEAAIFRKSIFNKIGNFDTAFFDCLHDLDIGWRAGFFGYKNMLCSSAIVTMLQNPQQTSDEGVLRLCARNNIFLQYKNMPSWQRALHAPMFSLRQKRQKRFYKKKGMGEAFVIGLKEGAATKKRMCKKRYVNLSPSRQMAVGRQMFANTFK